MCGQVVSATYASGTRGEPTFLNLDKPYPNPVFTILIWGSDHAKLGSPETTFKNKRICVSGKIQEYRGGAEIAAKEVGQITVER